MRILSLLRRCVKRYGNLGLLLAAAVLGLRYVWSRRLQFSTIAVCTVLSLLVFCRCLPHSVVVPQAPLLPSEPVKEAVLSPVSAPPTKLWFPGGLTADGKFVFFHWRPGTMDETDIYLLSDYGFALINEGSYDSPRAVYVLGFLKEKRVKTYRSLAAFKQGLKSIPHGASVYTHTVCTAGTSAGISEETRQRVARAFRRAHLKFDAEKLVMYCTCEPGGHVSPDVPPELKSNYIRVFR